MCLFLSKTLGSPYGFLRVQYNTPYEKIIRNLESSTNRKLLGELDENMLTYQCKYQDPSIGLHAIYMRLFYDWINPYIKRMNVEAMKGDKTARDKLNKTASYWFTVFFNKYQAIRAIER